MNKNHAQQGDVLIERIEKLPSDIKKVYPIEGRYVIAHGESGHTHAIAETDPSICELYEKDGILYVKANQSVSLKHEEHKEQIIEPGIYQIRIVKEYDYFQEMERKVID